MLCTLMAVTGLFHAPGEMSRHVLMPDLARLAGTPFPGSRVCTTPWRAGPG